MSRKNKSEFLSSLGTCFEVWKAVVDAVLAAGGSDEHLRALKGDKAKLAAIGAIVVGKGETVSNVETVTVPDLPAEAMLAAAEEAAGLTYVNPGYRDWNVVRGGRGRTYEVLKWNPGRRVSSDEVREHFRFLGAKGDAAAFVAWVKEGRHSDGWYVSVPEDAGCFCDAHDLYAPNFNRNGSCRGLRLSHLSGDWHDGSCFVGFRELPA
jgi:hypothetical protein